MEMSMTDEAPALPENRDLKTLVEEFERGIIVAALQETGGNQRRAARALGLLPTTLHEKMKRLRLIERPPHMLRDRLDASR
jgi:DNA-binding NtrC family response regulator